MDFVSIGKNLYCKEQFPYIVIRDNVGFVLEIAFKNSQNKFVAFNLMKTDEGTLQVTFIKEKTDTENMKLHLHFNGHHAMRPIVRLVGIMLELPSK